MREGQGGRNRVYTPRDRTRLKLTLRGKRLGLTLSEIKSIVDMYESPKDTAPRSTASSACWRTSARRSSSSARTSRCRWRKLPPTKTSAGACWLARWDRAARQDAA
jgi:DNA-binding transcriptional MerR regulator